MNLCAGTIVRSKAGRDKGRYFAVLGAENENFVFVADGRKRRVDNPKRKRVKHLEDTGKNSAYIAEKIRNGLHVTNPDLKKELQAYCTEYDV